MLTVNLLPQEEKAFVRREEMRLLLKFFATGASAAFLLGSIFLLPTFLTVAFTEREINRALALEEKAAEELDVRETEERVREIQIALGSLKGSLTAPSNASRVLEGLLVESRGITVTALAVKKNGALSLGGRAALRRDLLDFEEKLRASGLFQELSFPLSNLVRETNISFTLEGTLAPRYRL